MYIGNVYMNEKKCLLRSDIRKLQEEEEKEEEEEEEEERRRRRRRRN